LLQRSASLDDQRAPIMSRMEPRGRSDSGKLRLLLLTGLFPPAVGGASELFRILTEVWEQEALVEQVVILTQRGRKDSPAHEIRGKTLVHRLLPPTRRVKRQLDPVCAVDGHNGAVSASADVTAGGSPWKVRKEGLC
jgi:hypothetical protein